MAERASGLDSQQTPANVVSIFRNIRENPRYGNAELRQIEADEYLIDAIGRFSETGQTLPPPETVHTVAADILQSYVERIHDSELSSDEAKDWLDLSIESVATEKDLAVFEYDPVLDEPEPLPSAPVKSTKDKLKELEVEEDARSQELSRRFYEARDEFALISAAFSSGKLRAGRLSRKYSHAALADSETGYRTSLKELVDHEVKVSFNRGVIETNEIDEQAGKKERELHEGLIVAVTNERNVASGRHEYITKADGDYRRDHDTKVKNIQPKYTQTRWRRRLRRKLDDFYEWWGEQNAKGWKGKIRKGAATAAMGLPFAAVGAVTAPLLLPVIGTAGAAGAVMAASGISRSMMVFKLDKRSKYQADNQIEELLSTVKDNPDAVSSKVVSQAKEGLKDSRKRLAIALGTVAVGIVAGEAAHVAPGLFSHGHSPAAHHSLPARGVGRAISGTPIPKFYAAPPSGVGHAIAGTRIPSFNGATRESFKHIYVNTHRIGNLAVSSVYERAEGVHRGFLSMLHAAHQAIKEHLLEKVQPDPSNPNLFWYKVTKKGAKKFAKGAVGSSKTIDVMRVLSHTGRLSILHR